MITGACPLSSETAAALAEALSECLSDGQPKAVLELQHVPHIDSAGLEALVDLQDQFEQRAGWLKLAAPTPLCRDILAATGVTNRFEIHRETKAAIGSFVQ